MMSRDGKRTYNDEDFISIINEASSQKTFNAHSLTIGAIEALLTTSQQQGLTHEQATKRLSAFGRNLLTSKKEGTALKVLWQQFTGVAVYLLLAAASVSFILQDVAEAIAILIVIVLNALIGFSMEWKSVTSLRALKHLDVIKAQVIRDGKKEEILSEEITIGDLLYIEAGDIIPADARVVSVTRLQVNESALTGESLPVMKEISALKGLTEVAERANMLYKGTSVTNGSGYAIVTAIGNQTELGKISLLVQQPKTDVTPLEKQLQLLSKNLVWVTLIIAVAIYILGITKGNNYFLMLETAIAMAVAAIPEGLPIVATITLAKGMLRMSKKNVIIKKLPSVETLGKTDVILTDKTGTLTRNEITVNHITTSLHGYNMPADKAYRKNDKWAFYRLRVVSVLCNNAYVDPVKKTGDPIEIALLEWANQFYSSNKISKKYEKIDELPFDAQTKSMAALHKRHHSYIVTVKGALENILPCCTHELSGAELITVTQQERSAWTTKNEKLAAQGFRVLAFAYKQTKNLPAELMTDLTMIGLVAFQDPPRQNIVHAIETCKKAGIKTVMVTGDHPSTALQIAHQLQLTNEHHVISGNDVKTPGELDNNTRDKILHTSVFARVTPEQKLTIVSVYQAHGHIVAMTGDGINDAPALKKADVGIAMGKRGTQIAKDAADIILTDDSFNSIEAAIEEGRVIFENIRKSVIYLLSCNLAEVLIIAVITFLYFTSPLSPLQILFLNLLTDVLPALALGMSKRSVGIMQKPPRKNHRSIITAKHWKEIVFYALVITICICFSHVYCITYLKLNRHVADNIVFWSLALAQLWHSFNLSDDRSSIFKNEVFKNKYVWFAVIICVTTLIAAYVIPVLKNILYLQHLNVSDFVIIFITSIAPVFIIQFFKKS